MASARAGDLGRHLGRLFGAGTAVGLTDGELLERFAQRRDKSAEDAFETLLFRHGAMVLTICQHLLRDVHAAEDVFQATFLVLVRRAGSLRIRDHGSVGPWLYGVAYRLALKGREGAARRRRRERRVAVAQVEEASTAVEDYEFQALVHDEVNRLPTKYRAPIVLCYFEGRTHDEAAAALRWPVGTVRGRLARARDLLRARLSRRGLAPAEWFEATLLGPGARIEPPAQLLEATVTAAIDGIPAVAAGAMANLMLRGLFMARLGMTAAIFAMVLMMAGFGLAIGNMPRWQPSLGPHRPPASVATVQTALPAFDSVGDPLPKYALARMGTTRFHGGSLVNQVLYTPDGKSLVTVDNIPIVRVWDASTGQLVRDIGDRQADFPEMTPSRAIALSPDGQTLVTVDYPNQLRLWDLATGRESRRWREVKGAVYGHPLFSPDGRSVTVSVTRDDEANNTSETFIELCEIASPTERRRRIPGGWVRLWDLKFSPDGKTLAAASRDSDIMRGNTLIEPDKGTIRLWDNDAGRERRRISLNRLDVRSIAFSSDGKTLAAAVNVGTVRFYNVDTGQEDIPPLGLKLPRRPGKDVEALLIPPEGSGRLAFSPDGTLLAFRHAAIQLWDVNQGLELRRFADNLQGVTSISFSPDGKTLASSGGGPELRLWDVATGREAFSRSGHSAAIRSLVVSPADGTVFNGGDDGTILHWDPSSGRELDPVAPLAGPVDELAVAPNGTTLLVAGRMDPYEQPGARISLWSVAENRQILRLGAFTDHDFTNLAYAPDGKTFASEGLIWDVSSGRLLSRLRHQDPRHGDYLHFSPIFYVPDGKHVITAEPDGVWIWDSATGRELRQAIRWLNYHDRATLSADGRFLATRGPGGRSRGQALDPPIILWELASGRQVASLDAQGEALLRRPFSPDGRFLASANRHKGAIPNSTVRVLDLATGGEVRRFEGHRGSVTAVAFTPDGRSIVSASEDATALVWDISDLAAQQTLALPIPAEVLSARWDELAGEDARVAYRATWAMSTLSAVEFLRDHLRPASSPEAIAPREAIRTSRAITALERIATPEACAVLERMGHGSPDAVQTQDAKSALDRLSRRSRAQARSSIR